MGTTKFDPRSLLNAVYDLGVAEEPALGIASVFANLANAQIQAGGLCDTNIYCVWKVVFFSIDLLVIHKWLPGWPLAPITFKLHQSIFDLLLPDEAHLDLFLTSLARINTR